MKQICSLLLLAGLIVFISLNPAMANGSSTSNFSIITPGNGTNVNGAVTVTGAAGSAWVNVRAFANGVPVSADITPVGGTYTLGVDTTQLPVGPATISVMAFSVPAGQSGGTYVSANLNINVQHSAGSANTNFSVITPGNGANVDGTVSITGAAGSAWVNVRAFANGAPVSADMAPSGGTYALSLDTTQLPAGPVTIAVMAFSVPAGQSGGTYSLINLSLNVQHAVNKPDSLFGVTSPTSGANVSGTVSITGAAGAAWVNIRAFANGVPVSADTTPAGGNYTLRLDTTQLPAGPATISVMAFSVPAGQSGGTYALINLSLNVQHAVNGACGTANTAVLASIPTTNLCSTGTASSVAGTGPWNWSCAGANSGTTANCLASPTTTFTVSSPGNGANVAGTVTITGGSGAAWVNIRAFANGLPISADTTPVGGAYALDVDTTQLPTGLSTVSLMAFSVPAGKSGGMYSIINMVLNVQNTAKGMCGTANNATLVSMPTTNLCSKGTASPVSGTSTWTWSCAGTNNGTPVSCSAVAGIAPDDVSGFLNGFGINVHVASVSGAYTTDSPYTEVNGQNVFDPAKLNNFEAAVSYLGVKTLRDYFTNDPNIANAFPGPDGTQGTSVWQKINADTGVKFDFQVLAENGSGNKDPEQLNQLVSHANIISSIEGPNEVDSGWLVYVDPATGERVTGITAAQILQPYIYSYLKTLPALANIPVIQYSIANSDNASAAGTVTANDANYGNAHIYYPTGASPGSGYIPMQIKAGLAMTPNKSVFVTETGFATRANDALHSVSPAVQASYELTALFDLWSNGQRNIFLYGISDYQSDPENTNSELHYGVFNADWTPKPAAVALHNMTAILTDISAVIPNRPVALAYTLGVSTEPVLTPLSAPRICGELYQWQQAPNVQSHLFQRKDGTFILTLWNDVRLSDSIEQIDLQVPNTQVLLQLANVAGHIQIFDPLAGTAAINSYTNLHGLSVNVPAHPIFLFISP